MAAEAAYDPVAALYDRAFSDIRVRAREFRWLSQALDQAREKPRVLDLGCGNGALLEALAPRMASGTGADISMGMLVQAERRVQLAPNLRFCHLTGPRLPFADDSFDVVISFLSFRYLDWEESVREIRRVLAPGGRFLMVDLARKRVRPWETPRLAGSLLRRALTPLVHGSFTRDLQALTRHPAWSDMLRRHPMRTLRSYQRFFAHALPGAEFVVLDCMPSRRIVALDSGPLTKGA
jgi:ubiquinone/menaquinone biosynthesis C-methylase UbiE